MKRKLYLDNGSTSFPKAPGVGEEMCRFIEEVGCNISRGGYETSYSLAEKVFETRSLLCKLFNHDDERFTIFTPSITYSLNFVIQGVLKSGDHVIISGMEHNAVARTCEKMKGQGVEVSIAPCDEKGVLKLDKFESLFKDNTKLVAMVHASNVCGTILDAEKIGKICRKKDVYFALDAAQSAGTVDIDMQKMCVDALCVTGHKGLLGPQGIGALLLTPQIAKELKPLVCGGTGSISDLLKMPDFMPDALEPGTLNLPGIIGLNKSLQYIAQQTPQKILNHELDLAIEFINGIEKLSSVQVIGLTGRESRVGTVSLNFLTMDNADVAYRLDEEFGIMTRCGLHCAPLAHKSLGTFPSGTVRFAFGYKNTLDDVEYALSAIKKIIYTKQ